MKHTLSLLLAIAFLPLNAQNNGHNLPQVNFFDPEHDPVALRSDTTLQLLVSEYVLVKSVKARMGQDCQILKTYKNRSPNGGENLLFEGIYLAKNRQRFTLSVSLTPDAQGRFYYASSQALVCSAPGCNNCSIANGNCVGCCSSANGNAVSLPSPLLKVQTNLDD
ncbi:MAG: hypothetical protein H7246_01550 [Phycisphaerae bacterium]|nr:hypothetical protein [Saprospiraceae bacterium]